MDIFHIIMGAKYLNLEELENDLGQQAAQLVLATCGGQTLSVPLPENVTGSRIETEFGPTIALWLAGRYDCLVHIPSVHGLDRRKRAAALCADTLDAGLINPTRSASDIALEHGVSARRVQQLRQELRAERGIDARNHLKSAPDSGVSNNKGS